MSLSKRPLGASLPDIPTTFTQANEYYNQLGPGRMEPSKAHIEQLMELMDHPERSNPSIMVTGTNGKTSTTRMIGTILGALGLPVGLYTSPHLQSITERISIAGKALTTQEFLRYTQLLIPFIDHVNASSPARVSYFEALTAMAFTAFGDASVAVGVLEVGMGGAWDATNVVDNHIAVFTPISMDHPELGPTLEAKAREKSGIIKPQSTVLTSKQEPEVMAVLREVAQAQDATLLVEGEDFALSGRAYAVGGQVIDVRGLYGEYHDVMLPLFGRHQATNAALAIAACEVQARSMSEAAFVFNPEVLISAMSKVSSPGRYERYHLDDLPSVILDGAHNPGGMEVLAATLREDIAITQRIGIISILDDKDHIPMLREIAPLFEHIIVTPIANERSEHPERLVEHIESLGVGATLAEDPQSALDMALDRCEDTVTSVVIVTGSLYLVGEMREILEHT